MITPSHPSPGSGDRLRVKLMTVRADLPRQILIVVTTLCLHGAFAQPYPETVKVLLPDKDHAELYTPTFIIRWRSAADGVFYRITFRDLFGEELLKIETAANSIDVDWRDPKIADTDALLVEVQVKGNDCSKSPPNLVKKLSTKARKVIDKLLSAESDAGKEKDGSDKIARATFFEEHHLLIDALTAYEYAIAWAPDVAAYRMAYKAFLVRNKIDAGE